MNKAPIPRHLTALLTGILLVSMLLASCKEVQPPTLSPESTSAQTAEPAPGTDALETNPPVTTGSPDTDPPATSMPTTEPPVMNPPETTPPVTTAPPATEPDSFFTDFQYESIATIPVLGETTCYKTWSPWREGVGFQHNDYNVRVLDTYEEMNGVLTTYAPWYNLNHIYHGEHESVRQVYEKYTEEWFEDHALVTVTVGYLFGALSSDQETTEAVEGLMLSIDTMPTVREIGVTADGQLYVLLDRPYPENLTSEDYQQIRSNTKNLRFEVIVEVSKDILTEYGLTTRGVLPQLGGYHS